MATIHSVMLGKKPFANGKENFHANEKTVDRIIEQFFLHYQATNCQLTTAPARSNRPTATNDDDEQTKPI
jgi:hypothetical protein